MAPSSNKRLPLTPAEIRSIVVAAESTFLKIGNMYEELLPIFARYGFKPQSAGVVSRDVSEQIEQQITLHCKTFTRGQGFADLARHGQRWEVKICKGRGLTINQNAVIQRENYIVVNYSNYSTLRRVWILWEAEDRFFTPRKANLNLRTIIPAEAAGNVQIIFDATGNRTSHALPMAKAALPSKPLRKKTTA